VDVGDIDPGRRRELGEPGGRLEEYRQHAGGQGIERPGVADAVGRREAAQPAHDGKGSLPRRFVYVEDTACKRLLVRLWLRRH
jgi:hypothetical protein